MNIEISSPLLRWNQRPAAPHWRQRLEALGVPVWSAILAGVVFVGLLVAFHQVVTGAVQQGESRRRAVAALDEATWRCNFLRGPGASQGCLAQLGVAQVAFDDDAPPRATLYTRTLHALR